MKLNKLFLTAAVAMAGAAVMSSCSADNDYWNEGVLSGNTVVADNTATALNTLTLKPDADGNLPQVPDPAFTLTMSRGDVAGDLKVDLSILLFDNDEESATYGKFVLPNDGTWTIPASVTIPNGQQSVSFPVKLNKTGADIGVYRARVVIASNAAMTAATSWDLMVKIQGAIPDPDWVSLGKGTYINHFLFDNKYQVEIEQDQADYAPDQLGYYGHYRLVWPLKEGYITEGYVEDGNVTAGAEGPEYEEFWIIGPGENIPGVIDGLAPVANSENPATPLVYMEMHNIDFHNGSNGDIWAYYGIDLYNAGYVTNYSGQCVLGWATEPKVDEDTEEVTPGVPGAVSLGACYGLPPTDDGLMPGRYYVDYLGDTKGVQFIFPGYSLGDFTFDMWYAGQGMNPQKEEYIEVAVDFTGSDTKNIAVGLAPINDPGATYELLTNMLLGDDRDPELPEILYEIVDNPKKKTDNVAVVRFPVEESGVYTVVGISYDDEDGEQESNYITVKLTLIADMTSPGDWSEAGSCYFTDALLGMASLKYSDGSAPDQDDVTYSCPLLKHNTEPNTYAVVAPYGEDYPFASVFGSNFIGSDDNIILDLNDPDCVVMPEWVMGTRNYSDIGPQDQYYLSYSYYILATGGTIADAKATGNVMTIKDGVVTSTQKGILMGYSDYKVENLFFPSTGKDFRVIMPWADMLKAHPRYSSAKAKGAKVIRTAKIGTRVNLSSINSAKPVVKSGKKAVKKVKSTFQVPLKR